MSAVASAAQFEKWRIAQHFNRAATSYQNHNHLQRDCAAVLQREVCALTSAATAVVLDVGCGPGVASSFLAKRYAHYIGLDIAATMVARAKANDSANDFICADADALPFADQSIDCIYSNLTLQWCNDLTQTLAELQRVLRPQGCLLATTVLAGSLEPLTSAMQQVDGETHSNRFLSAAELNEALIQIPSVNATVVPQQFIYSYPRVRAIFNHLRGIGANYTARNESGLRSRNWLAAVEEVVEQHRKPHGGIEIEWNIGVIKLEKQSG